MCNCAGARVDTWVETGTEILPFFDSLLAKLMVHGSSRQDAVAKMQEALSNTVIGGIPSNLEYLETIAHSEGFAAGNLAHPLSAVTRSCGGCGLPVFGLSSVAKGFICILEASLVLHQTSALIRQPSNAILPHVQVLPQQDFWRPCRTAPRQ